jgi:hypothetical protein
VLHHLTGHADSRTRERIYQDPNNERVRAHAAEARRQMRSYLRGDAEGRERLAARKTYPASYPTRQTSPAAPVA